MGDYLVKLQLLIRASDRAQAAREFADTMKSWTWEDICDSCTAKWLPNSTEPRETAEEEEATDYDE